MDKLVWKIFCLLSTVYSIIKLLDVLSVQMNQPGGLEEALINRVFVCLEYSSELPIAPKWDLMQPFRVPWQISLMRESLQTPYSRRKTTVRIELTTHLIYYFVSPVHSPAAFQHKIWIMCLVCFQICYFNCHNILSRIAEAMVSLKIALFKDTESTYCFLLIFVEMRHVCSLDVWRNYMII